VAVGERHDEPAHKGAEVEDRDEGRTDVVRERMYGRRAPLLLSLVPATKKEKPALRSLSFLLGD